VGEVDVADGCSGPVDKIGSGVGVFDFGGQGVARAVAAAAQASRDCFDADSVASKAKTRVMNSI